MAMPFSVAAAVAAESNAVVGRVDGDFNAEGVEFEGDDISRRRWWAWAAI